MIKVTFDGIEFTKASEVAKQFNYTSDYLGQLCRSKKVNARLVGRTWFVNVPSLEAHRDKRYQNSKPVQKPVDKVSPEPESQMAAPASKTYLKRVQAPRTRVRQLDLVSKDNPSTKPVALQYETDDFSLIPNVDTKPKVTLLKVGIAESSPLKIKSSTKKESYLAPQPLPDVALSGKLKVQQIALEEEIDSDTSPKRDKPKNIPKNGTADIAHDKQQEATKKTTDPENAKKKQNFNDKSKVSKEKTELSPKIESLKIVQRNFALSKEQSSSSNVLIYISSVSVAVLAAFAILTLEQVGYGNSEAVEFSLGFSWSNLASLGAFLYTPS